MKKNLLFVMPSLSAGGGERSLVNLLSQIDYKLYNVDLCLLDHGGFFMAQLPESVQIIPVSGTYSIFRMALKSSIHKYLLQGDISLVYNRIMFSLRSRNAKTIAKREQNNWKYMSQSIDNVNKHYDAAIGFLEKTSTYFCVEKVNASKKIGWVHTDYNKLGTDPTFDFKYFEQLDYIVTVSEECANILKRSFPAQANKVNVIHNIVSSMAIHNMANEHREDVYNRKGDEKIILSIGRLNHVKGFTLAISACKLLVERGYDVQWYIIGEGEDREKLTKQITLNGLSNHVRLVGLKTNPYTFIKQADIYVQTSKFEGKSIAIDEAKILNKPIVVTRYNTAKDQINDGIDGLIVDMNADAIAFGIEKLLLDKGLAKKMVDHLSKQKLSNEDEINKLYRLFI